MFWVNTFSFKGILRPKDHLFQAADIERGVGNILGNVLLHSSVETIPFLPSKGHQKLKIWIFFLELLEFLVEDKVPFCFCAKQQGKLLVGEFSNELVDHAVQRRDAGTGADEPVAGMAALFVKTKAAKRAHHGKLVPVLYFFQHLRGKASVNKLDAGLEDPFLERRVDRKSV